MRRGPGLAGLQKRAEMQKRAAAVGEEHIEQHRDALRQQLPVFKERLEEFARKHRQQINKDPEFRMHFNQMCSMIGVDPLASTKGFWAETLGVGDFYYELAVQIVQVCMASRSTNGGLAEMGEVLEGLRRLRGAKAQQIGMDDIDRAVKALRGLGGGFDVISLGRKKVIQSVPMELSNDHTSIMLLAQPTGFVMKSQLCQHFGWVEERATSALGFLVHEGIVWIDEQSSPERTYWFPALVPNICSM